MIYDVNVMNRYARAYRHISSIEYEKPGVSGYLVGGISLLVSALILYISNIQFIRMTLPNEIYILLTVLGIILIILEIVIKPPPKYQLFIVGREPLLLQGKNLEDIVKVIRQYREHVDIS